MLDRVGEAATALDLTGVVSLPVWAVAGIAAALVLACALAFVRAGGEGRSLPAVILVLITLPLVFFQRRLLRHSRRFAAVGGKGEPRRTGFGMYGAQAVAEIGE